MESSLEDLANGGFIRLGPAQVQPGNDLKTTGSGQASTMDTATGYRYIVSTVGIRGGNPRIEGTRVAVHDIVAYVLMGGTMEEIRERYPDVSRSQIYECLAYYEDHRSEIESLALSQLAAPAA